MNKYLTGDILYGDDFTIEQIKEWYENEKEGYANINDSGNSSYEYFYHQLNEIHGFKNLKNPSYENVLGFGSAWGYEFEPIINKVKNLTIIEPSENLRSKNIGKIIPAYVSPEINGALKFSDNSFDLITCFGVLHHIPNVSFVLMELIRVLKPNGYLLIREPIISMGDWNVSRKGLTKCERGIPIAFFENILHNQPISAISKTYCFTLTSVFQKTIGVFLKKPIFSYKLYILFDKGISFLLKSNVHYHAKNLVQKISPLSVFYILSKTNIKYI